MEAIALRVEAIATRVEAMTTRVEAIATRNKYGHHSFGHLWYRFVFLIRSIR